MENPRVSVSKGLFKRLSSEAKKSEITIRELLDHYFTTKVKVRVKK
jgi:hypothetical protein